MSIESEVCHGGGGLGPVHTHCLIPQIPHSAHFLGDNREYKMSDEDKEQTKIELRKILETRKMHHKFKVDRDFLISANVDVYDLISDNISIIVEKFMVVDWIADDEYQQILAVDHTTSTWQKFKSLHAGSWWLGWLVRRRPVSYRTDHHLMRVNVERFIGYPEAVIPSEKLGRPLIWEDVHISELG